MDAQANGNARLGLTGPGLQPIVSRQICNSFLGADRILDLFDGEILRAAETALAASDPLAEIEALLWSSSKMKPAVSLDELLTDNTLNMIVDRVVRRISADAIREVAWEVVPELSESILRRTIEEQQNKA